MLVTHACRHHGIISTRCDHVVTVIIPLQRDFQMPMQRTWLIPYTFLGDHIDVPMAIQCPLRISNCSCYFTMNSHAHVHKPFLHCLSSTMTQSNIRPYFWFNASCDVALASCSLHLKSYCIAIQKQDIVKAQLLHRCTCVRKNNLINLSRTDPCIQTRRSSKHVQICIHISSARIPNLRLSSLGYESQALIFLHSNNNASMNSRRYQVKSQLPCSNCN